MTKENSFPGPARVTVGFISLGCAKNLVDAQLMAGNLLADDIALAPSPEEADIVIVNTCAFVEDARVESLDTIRAACELKRRGRCRAVLVTGCLAQRYRARLLESLPDVDGFVGLDELQDVPRVVRRLAAGEHGLLAVSASATRLFEPAVPGVNFSGGPFAYLKIAEGCNHRCAFCAIPGIRGAHRSRTIDQVAAEAEQLLERGVRELNLISQDVTAYGSDLRDGTSLARLLRRLGGLGGRFWIRWLYGYPSHVTDELLAAMGDVSNVCHYLDVPIQHSDPDILRAMRRAGTIRHLERLPARVRAALPDAALRTTCLVGFPGETDARFQRLLDYVRRSEFDHLGVFVYSPEDGTAARDLPGRPPRAVAEKRRERLMLAQQAVVAGRLKARIGQEAEVLIERRQRAAGRRRARPEIGVARSRREAPQVDGVVLVEGLPPAAASGTFARVRYTGVAGYDLRATAIGAGS